MCSAVGDLLVGQPVGHRDEDLALAVGEAVVLGGATRLRQGGELLDQPPGDATGRAARLRRRRPRSPRAAGSGRVSLSRKPLAPARSASCTSASSSKVVSTSTCVRRAGRVGHDPPGRLEAVHPRHPDVHQHHVGRRTTAQLQRRGPVAGLADDLDVVGSSRAGRRSPTAPAPGRRPRRPGSPALPGAAGQVRRSPGSRPCRRAVLERCRRGAAPARAARRARGHPVVAGAADRRRPPRPSSPTSTSKASSGP